MAVGLFFVSRYLGATVHLKTADKEQRKATPTPYLISSAFNACACTSSPHTSLVNASNCRASQGCEPPSSDGNSGSTRKLNPHTSRVPLSDGAGGPPSENSRMPPARAGGNRTSPRSSSSSPEFGGAEDAAAIAAVAAVAADGDDDDDDDAALATAVAASGAAAMKTSFSRTLPTPDAVAVFKVPVAVEQSVQLPISSGGRGGTLTSMRPWLD